MYYDIVKSGERINGLRTARKMTRQQLAEYIDCQWMLCRRFSMQDEAEQKAKIDRSRRMSSSMSMNRRSLMLQKVPTLLMEVLVLSL